MFHCRISNTRMARHRHALILSKHNELVRCTEVWIWSRFSQLLQNLHSCFKEYVMKSTVWQLSSSISHETDPHKNPVLSCCKVIDFPLDTIGQLPHVIYDVDGNVAWSVPTALIIDPSLRSLRDRIIEVN